MWDTGEEHGQLGQDHPLREHLHHVCGSQGPQEGTRRIQTSSTSVRFGMRWNQEERKFTWSEEAKQEDVMMKYTKKDLE
jgi:hypothetical protein